MPVPAISFAIPYYRNVAYLLETIMSVRKQTVDGWELTVVDDAGPEPAHDLVDAIGDPRITYVRNVANLGLARNWNECVRLARGPLVNVVHADDRLLPEFGARVLEAAARHPDAAAVFTDVTIIGPDGEPTRTLPDLAKRLVSRPRHDHDLAGDRSLAGLLAGNYILCPTLCIRPAIVGTAPFDPTWKFVPDQAFTVGQLLAGRTLHSIRSPLLEYRRHESSQTSALTSDSSRFDEELEFSRQMAVEAAARGWTRSARAARWRVLTRTHLLLRLGLDLVGRRFGAAQQKRRILWSDLRHRDRVGAHDPDAE